MSVDNPVAEGFAYDRGYDLKRKFNNTIINLLNIPRQDYYSRLTTEQMLSLKIALSDINNVITLRLASSLADWIYNKLDIAEESQKQIFSTMISKKPNANGYDIDSVTPNIVAEVKCHIPINEGWTYGSNQITQLKKDINGLLNGKPKFSRKTDGAFKILGLLDTPKVRAATDHFVRNLASELKQKMIVDPNQSQNLDSGHVYVVFVK